MCVYRGVHTCSVTPAHQGHSTLLCIFFSPQSRNLTRVHWRQIRRLMGKPRRCSPTFFTEERNLMEYRRNKVRKLQQQVHQGVVSGGREGGRGGGAWSGKCGGEEKGSCRATFRESSPPWDLNEGQGREEPPHGECN